MNNIKDLSIIGFENSEPTSTNITSYNEEDQSIAGLTSTEILNRRFEQLNLFHDKVIDSGYLNNNDQIGSMYHIINRNNGFVNINGQKGNGFASYNISELKKEFKENPEYTGIKLSNLACIPDFTWLVLDFDDKKCQSDAKQLYIDFKTKFKLEHTFTTKTPTGEGRQCLYLIKDEDAAILTDFKFYIKEYNVEAFVLNKNSESSHRPIMPGSTKNKSMYVVEYLNDEVCGFAMASSLILGKFMNDQKASNGYAELKLQARKLDSNSEIDSESNLSEAIDKINSEMKPFKLAKGANAIGEGDGVGRNTTLYRFAIEIMTRGVSKETATELIRPHVLNDNNYLVDFDETEFNEVMNSAWNSVMTAGRNLERASHMYIEDIEKDEHGQFSLTRAQIETRAAFLSKYSDDHIMKSDQLRNILYSTLFRCSATAKVYRARMEPEEKFRKEYRRSLDKESSKGSGKVKFNRILDMLCETKLHWDEYTNTVFTASMRYVNPKGRTVALTNVDEYLGNVPKGKIIKSVATDDLENVWDGSNYNMQTESALTRLDDMTEEEESEAAELLNRMMHWIVSPRNPESDINWIKMRYAMMLQDPSEDSDSIPVFEGLQGSGKSLFISVMHMLFAVDDTSVITSYAEYSDKFIAKNRVTNIEDVDTNEASDIMGELKAKSTAPKRVSEKKFKDQVSVYGSNNYSICTNNKTVDPEVLGGRRFSIFVNREPFSRTDREEETKEIMLAFKINDFRLLNALYTHMMNLDVSSYSPDYGTIEQKNRMLHTTLEPRIMQSLISLVNSWGYVNEEYNIFDHEYINQNDLKYVLVYHQNVYSGLEPQVLSHDCEGDKKLYATPLKSVYFTKGSLQVKNMLNVYLKDTKELPKAKIPSAISGGDIATNCIRTPTMRRMIAAITSGLTGPLKVNETKESGIFNHAAISYVIEKFGFEEQWEKGAELKIDNRPAFEELKPVAMTDTEEPEDHDEDSASEALKYREFFV